MTGGEIHLLNAGKHELWYRVVTEGVLALHKPTGLAPERYFYSSFTTLLENLGLLEKEFDRHCPGCAEARSSPLLAWADIEWVAGAETTLEGHRFRIYREHFEGGEERVLVVHLGEGQLSDFCFQTIEELSEAWPTIIKQISQSCAGCSQQGE